MIDEAWEEGGDDDMAPPTPATPADPFFSYLDGTQFFSYFLFFFLRTILKAAF